ncbi:MAG: sugar phosphate isomerase/epimerase, partial [Clostridia bacterium]|nr:sugar phosphate isomerase/epimerase [Clostridia bacterium]
VYALIDENGNEIKNDNKEDNKFEFRPVGYGLQDVKAIVEASIKAGAGYLIVEQDNSYDNDSLENAKKSRDYLKSIGY